ncbi:MAG: PAS domain-containing protein [Bacteroidota bacterium]
MKKTQKFRHIEFTVAFLFLVFAWGWIFFTNLVFRSNIFTDICMAFVLALLVFFAVRFSRKKVASMTREYRNLFETHPNPMWIYDNDTLKFVAVNEAAIRNYGYSKKEFLNMTIFDIRLAADIPVLQDRLATDLEPARDNIWRHVKKNGEEILVKIVSNDVTFNKRRARLIDALDVTEMSRQQEQIREMSLVAENTTNGVILSDGQGRIKWVNKAFERTTGYCLSEVKGKFPRTFLHGPETDRNVEAEINELVRQKKGFVGEIINYKKDGTPYWIHLNLSPILSNNEIENIVVIQTDVTELKQQSEKIADQYKRLREVAFMVSHNARAPLTNILGLCDIIDQQSFGPKQKELAGYLKESAVKLDQVIHHIVKQTSDMDQESLRNRKTG